MQELLAERMVGLSSVPKTYTFDLRPPVAGLDLAPLIRPAIGAVRLEITPTTPGLAIWGFVSLTDNLTQAISLRIPNESPEPAS